MLDVTYQNGVSDSQWYPTTYRGGYSLVLVDAAGDPNSAASWRASTSPGGSPGVVDPVSAYGTIVINEVLAHTDLPLEDSIELYNAGTTTVDIAGWYLSDTADDLRRYQIPTAPALSLPPGSCHVFYASSSFGSRFMLSELGESVYLSSATGTNLTAYRTWEAFGATDNGFSLGRHLRSDGVWDFTALSALTLGTHPNAAPQISPVLISEIMYNPAPDAAGLEFVELFNHSVSSVPLYNQTNAWRFDAGIEYQLPQGLVMAAGERILITAMEPGVFRAALGLTNLALRIYGPFAGSLNNAGDTLQLSRPGDTEPNGTVPWVAIDRIEYEDRAPWPPEADGVGPSLERRTAPSYGNDPTNWQATAFGGTPGTSNNAAGTASIAFSSVGMAATESNGTLQVELVALPAPTGTVSVTYTVSGTATAGADYVLSAGTATFGAYETARTLALRMIDDATSNELDETVVVTLTGISAGTAVLGGNRSYTLTIVDNDPGVLPPPIIQPGGSTIPFTNPITVTMTSSVPGSVIHYTLDGTTPDVFSAVYTQALVLASSAKLSARTGVGSYSLGAVTSVWFASQSAVYVAGPDEDRDGMADAWEISYFGATNAVAGQPGSDADGDGHSNLEEYITGTHPGDPDSCLALKGLGLSGAYTQLRWPAAAGRTYNIYRSTNLRTPWSVWPYQEGVAADASGTNLWVDYVSGTGVFYRISVRP